MADINDSGIIDEPTVVNTSAVDPGADVEMAESSAAERSELPFAGEETVVEEEPVPARTPFVDYLTSPVVTLIVGTGERETILTAHQALLSQSPHFENICDNFSDDGSVSTPANLLSCDLARRHLLRIAPSETYQADQDFSCQPRQLELPDEDMDAVGCFLEFLYTGEYFPKKVAGSRALEEDPTLPLVDDTGDHLLKHARVYTLAEKFGLPTLRTLASSKIHCVSSTAKGEIAYAEYVYANTPEDDTTIRAPIASFWASRSHTLRAEAEPEFKALCLQYPQFGYDVLSKYQ